MHIIAVLVVAMNQRKPLSCPSTGDWLNKTVIYLCDRISKTLSWRKKSKLQNDGYRKFSLKHVATNNMICHHLWVCVETYTHMCKYSQGSARAHGKCTAGQGVMSVPGRRLWGRAGERRSDFPIRLHFFPPPKESEST